jgi:type I restriction enzyme S subunit
MRIPFPPLDEQKRIVKILEEKLASVEKAKKAAEEKLQAANTLKQSYLNQIFNGEESKKCKKVKLEDVCISNSETRNPCNNPVEYFKYVDITSVDNKLKKIIGYQTLIGENAPSRARKVIRQNDVIVSTTRPNLNAVALIPSELDNEICSTGFCVLRTQNNLLPDFLFAYVQTDIFIKKMSDLVKGALYPAVTDKQVFSDSIPLSPLTEQKRITNDLNHQFEKTDKLTEKIQAELELINKLPQSYLKQAFEGKL